MEVMHAFIRGRAASLLCFFWANSQFDSGHAASYDLQVTSFVEYPGSSTNATISGVVYINPVMVNGTVQHKLTWKLTGTDDACPTGSGNVCGIHVHEGKDCSNAATIGGHFHKKGMVDPWTTVRYDSSVGVSTDATGSMVATGLSPNELLGRTVVVHNSIGAGERIACGIARAAPTVPLAQQLVVKKWVKYPGSNWPLTVSGTVTITQKAGVLDTLGLGWNLKGTDDACPTGSGNVCGIHIHSGMTCDVAAAVGGHYWDKDAISKDPWTDVRYTSTGGSSTSPSIHVEVVTGFNRSSIIGRSVVIHNSKGAGERIACGIIEESGSDSNSTTFARGAVVSFAYGPMPVLGFLMLFGMLLSA